MLQTVLSLGMCSPRGHEVRIKGYCMVDTTALEMHSISKAFPGTLAVDDVSFEVHVGEVHALCGENGAGKSTLMKILAGSYDDYTGSITISGKEVKLHTPAKAKSYGIGMIYQELSLAQPLSIAENILVGRIPKKGLLIDREKMVKEARRCLKLVGLEHLDPLTPVEDISQHEGQLVEIAKALGNNPCVLVMDEPTSALSREEVTRLFRIIQNLKNRGISVVYISHHLPEIFEVADRITVLRDGKKIATKLKDEITSEQLVQMMIGHSVTEFYKHEDHSTDQTRLEVRHLYRNGFFHDVSFTARKGEVLGICGLSGAGRSELAKSLVALDGRDSGEVLLDGKPFRPRTMGQSIKEGIAYLTENRKSEGLALRLDVRENTLAAIIPELSNKGVFPKGAGEEALKRLIEVLSIYPADPDRTVGNLSGGNQQKVLLAKWIAAEPKVLILDEPTRGVDIGAKMIIHDAIEELAKAGHTILLISSDLPELVSLSNRVLVMRKGKFIKEMPKEACTEESVLLAANGEGA